MSDSDLIERLERTPTDLEWTEDKGSHNRLAIGRDAHQAAARIKELEGDSKDILERMRSAFRLADSLRAERDAIEAATIRDCATACGSMSTEGLGSFEERLKIQMALCLAADRIRALAKPSVTPPVKTND